MEGKDLISSINWNNIINVDARSIDRASLGKVQGLFEPCVVVENGNLVKETYYIPKSVIEKYDHEALYFRLTEQEVKDNCIRDSPPSEEDAEQIRITAERIASTQRSIVLHSENQEEDILRKLMEAVSEFKDKISSGAKRAKEKIEENQIQKDEQRISKMGELATTFTDSFDRVMSEIKTTTHTYAEQAQIYDGFMKLLEQQRELVSARKELASRLKSSVKEPLSSESQENNTESPEGQEAQKQDLKEIRKVASMEPTAQKVEFVQPTNGAPSTISMTTTTTSSNNKNKVYQENQFMVIEPPAIKYCKVAIKPSQKRTKKEEKENDSKNPS